MLTFDQVQTAAVAASARFTAIKPKYSDIKPYLVYASPYGQSEIHAGPTGILREFPQMVVDSQEKTKAVGILKAIKQAEDKKDPEKALPKLHAELLALVARFRFKGDTNIEIRLDRLLYERIRELKQEALVDRQATVQSDASIRIIIGTVAQLAEPVGASREH